MTHSPTTGHTGTRLRDALVLDAEPIMVARARRRVRHTLTSWGLLLDLDLAIWLTSELVTNAVNAAKPGQQIHLQITGMAGRVRIAVTDPGRGRPEPARTPLDAETECGRGLDLIVLLASTWGIEQNAAGTCVHFTLPTVPSVAPVGNLAPCDE